jgi:3-methylfumaryl-CoA hydratase
VTELDIAALRQWIGRTECASDLVTPRLALSLRATLESDEAPGGELAPACVHWCLAPPVVRTGELDEDGHPARGEFLPPVALPRRMWAASELTFHDALQVGDAVKRVSRVVDVRAKQGRTGQLCFVTVQHEIATARGLALTERQEIVYRERQAPLAQPAEAPGEARVATWRREVRCSPVLLFRYSALTFNAHRIHYDAAFSREHEGYPGLVVHAPLQSSYLLELATSVRDGCAPRRFAFRAVAPLFVDATLSANAIERDGGLQLWIADEAGRTTMRAEAFW